MAQRKPGPSEKQKLENYIEATLPTKAISAN